MLAWHDCLACARSLLDAPGGDVAPRRAISTIYYGVLHVIARQSADLLVSHGPGETGTASWLRVYRSLDHGAARRACSDREWLRTLAEPHRRLAVEFVALQRLRHDADYNPAASFSADDVAEHIDTAEQTIEQWLATPAEERLGFCVRLLFRNRAQAA